MRSLTGKVVVLVNDFGAAGIDGEIYSAGGIESIELPSGCVCCTLKFDLITTIGKIMKEFAPEHLVIEPSGVASPSGVLEALESAGAGPACVIGIVDATEFTELYESGMYGGFFEDQIVNSDVILLNKTDLAEGEKTADAIRIVESINPRAMLFRTVSAVIEEPLTGVTPGRRTKSTAPHFHFDTVSVRLRQGLGLEFVTKFFGDLAGGVYGQVIRAKALVQTDQGPYRFETAFGNMDIAPFAKDIEDSRIVIIGNGFDGQAIQRALS